mgnify:CR=1 FL=1
MQTTTYNFDVVTGPAKPAPAAPADTAQGRKP